MAHARTVGSDAQIVGDGGRVNGLQFIVDPSQGDNLVGVGLFVDGEQVATLCRFKGAGDRVAADFPGCDPGYVIVDENGQITNG